MGTRMEGKVAIITGATLGLGKAGALAVAASAAVEVPAPRRKSRRSTDLLVVFAALSFAAPKALFWFFIALFSPFG